MKIMGWPLWLRKLIIASAFFGMFAACGLTVFEAPDWLEPMMYQKGLRTMDGESLNRVEDAVGNEATVLVVNFFSTWCDVCQKEQPGLNQAHHEFVKKYDDAVVMIGVDIGESENAVRRYIEKYNVPYQVLLGWIGGPPTQSGSVPYTVVLFRPANEWLIYKEFPGYVTFATLDVAVEDAITEVLRG
jgi:thiol-disulfide isomerase/thioredoxin